VGYTVVEAREQSAIRRHIATNLGASYRNVMQLPLRRDVDATALVDALSLARTAGSRVRITDCLIAMAAKALRAHPTFNANFVDGPLNLIQEINIGIAVDTPSGLLVPVIKDADGLSLDEIAQRRISLTNAVMHKEHRLADISDATFTISNLGALGVDSFDPIISAPQVAILGVGRIRDLSAREPLKSMSLSLVFDHRVHDGSDAARFLATIVAALELPSLIGPEPHTPTEGTTDELAR
jgi:pyruvate/2-oxoglutarate dehydrogenase complex dihydrolipoamide acyltransferase (E2) component